MSCNHEWVELAFNVGFTCKKCGEQRCYNFGCPYHDTDFSFNCAHIDESKVESCIYALKVPVKRIPLNIYITSPESH